MFERTQKQSHLDTVRYEIDMLRFCSESLSTDKSMSIPTKNLFIEGFLLHYRNLIRFFSGNNHRAGNANRTADLSTSAAPVWALRELSKSEIDEMQRPAIALDDKYFEVISQYLQHCTERRYKEPKDWNIELMESELKPISDTFEKTWKRERPLVVRTGSANSTSTTAFTGMFSKLTNE